MLLYFLRCPPPFFGVPTVLFTMLTIPLFKPKASPCSYILYIHYLVYTLPAPASFSSICIYNAGPAPYYQLFFCCFLLYLWVCVRGTLLYFPSFPPQYPQKQYFSTSKICKKPQGNPYSRKKIDLQSLSQRYRNAIANEKTKLPLDKLAKVWYTTL